MPESYDQVDFEKCEELTYGEISDCSYCPMYQECQRQEKQKLNAE